MLPKEEFIRLASRGRPFSSGELEELDGQYESAAEAARELNAAMPSVGFFSVEKRLNAFLAVCRHIDQLVELGRITDAEGQLSLLVLRLANSFFEKASVMFDIRAERYDIRSRALMPRAAQQYMAGLRTYG